jgi:predicted carbohydrate-binding protein with CBM5 and CBM33 domain|tara:strand:- start:4563 stop:4820 length:258 start_codon:yes stop_codon:yes gene_type:complete
VLDENEKEMLLRWDEVFLTASSKAGQDGMEAFKAAVQKSVSVNIPLQKKGDTLVLDNWRMLHGRSHIGQQFLDRRISRAYLEEIF